MILQHEIKNSKTKIYIASFQMALELGYLKGGYVNFGFAALDLYCKITAICCTCMYAALVVLGVYISTTGRVESRAECQPNLQSTV